MYPELRYKPGQISAPVRPPLLLVHIIYSDCKLLRSPKVILTALLLKPMQAAHGSSAMHQPQSSTEPKQLPLLVQKNKVYFFQPRGPRK